MMEKIMIAIPSDLQNMTYSIQKQQNVNASIYEKPPLTQALNHIEMEIQQQAEAPELASKAMVSHVPVSIGSEMRSSSSTICSLSCKEGLENEDIMSMSATTHSRPLTESKKINDSDTIPTGVDPQGLAPTEKNRATPNTIQKSSIKSSSSSSDVSTGSSCNRLESSPPPVPSSITSRPAKKPRRISIESTHPTTTDVVSSNGSSQIVSSPLRQQRPPMLLLAQDEDEKHLNPLHVFVRKQIEVFTATAAELAQPAPGRKQPIQLNQVGLRCIHCRNVPHNGAKKARVKRAVCYPSAIGRIYHSVSDMKFDHFTHCKEVPSEVRRTFETLKAEGKAAHKEKKSRSGSNGSNNKGASSSSTAKYYRDSASRMGLVDSPGGIIYMNTAQTCATQHRSGNQNMVSATVSAPSVPPQLLQAPPTATTYLQRQQQQQEQYRKHLIQQQSLAAVNTAAVASMLLPPIQMSSILAVNNKENFNLDLNYFTTAMNSGSILQSLLMNAVAAGANAQKSIDAAIALAKEQQNTGSPHPQQNPLKRPRESSSSTHSTAPVPSKSFEGSAAARKITRPLASPEDAEALNPLHCFVRKHVELFSADKNDIDAPCPGRKTRVTLGQVGIRCKHCAKLNLKPRERVKRAVCYPPSIDGIYHSVSNMKFDHFGICPGLPEEAKKELVALRTSSSGRNVSGTNTAHYYRDSAVAKGLVDTDKGIRFGNTSEIPVVATTKTVPQPNLAPCASATPPISVGLPSVAGESLPQFPSGISALMMAAASHATSI